MKAPHALALVATLLAAQGAWASPQLAQQKTCMACHSTDRKIVGPSYKDVAAKYAAQKDAAAGRAHRQGSSGVWAQSHAGQGQRGRGWQLAT